MKSLVVGCSYKEESDDVTDSDDLIEIAETAEADGERDAAETIERVMLRRVGRKGGLLL